MSETANSGDGANTPKTEGKKKGGLGSFLAVALDCLAARPCCGGGGMTDMLESRRPEPPKPVRRG